MLCASEDAAVIVMAMLIELPNVSAREKTQWDTNLSFLPWRAKGPTLVIHSPRGLAVDNGSLLEFRLHC